MKIFIKDGVIEKLNLNPHHFKSHGRIYSVDIIDYDMEEVTVSTPSRLEFNFKEVKFLRFTYAKDSLGKEIYEDDIIECNGKGYIVYWDEEILVWRVKSIEPPDRTYYCYNLSSLIKKESLKIVGNINEFQSISSLFQK